MSAWQQAKIFLQEVRALKTPKLQSIAKLNENATEEEKMQAAMQAAVAAQMTQLEQDQKNSQDELEFVTAKSEALLLEAPSGASLLISICFLFLIALLSWAAIDNIDEVVKGGGKVVPSSHIQVIQNLEGGILEEIKVTEGEIVKKDQLLVIIDDTNAQSELAVNSTEYNALLAKYARLNAFLEGQESIDFDKTLKNFPDLKRHETQTLKEQQRTLNSLNDRAKAQVEQRKQEVIDARTQFSILTDSLKFRQKELKLNEPLLEKGAISEVAMLQLRQSVNKTQGEWAKAKQAIPRNEAALRESQQQSINAESDYREKAFKERGEVETRLKTALEKSTSLEDKVSRKNIQSPIDGIVKSIAINTVGGVIRPGMPIMEIVPTDDELIVETKIKPKDIGFIREGLQAEVKITAFDFSRFGGLKGKVLFISADTTTDKKGESFYTVRIKTKNNTLSDKNGETHTIIPGMQTQANIVINQTNILHFLLKPILR